MPKECSFGTWHTLPGILPPCRQELGLKKQKCLQKKTQTKTRHLLIVLFSIQHHAVVEHSRLGGNDQDVWDTGQAQHGAGVIAVVVLSRRVHGQGAQQLPEAASAARNTGLFSAPALQGHFPWLPNNGLEFKVPSDFCRLQV